MKKIIISILLLFLFGFTDNKPLEVKGDLPTWQKHINKLEIIRQIADNSDMSNQQVKFITKTIDSLELFIVPQIQSQLPKDTTQKK